MNQGSSLKSRWDHFWFEPQSALSLGLCRAVVFAYLFLFVAPEISKFSIFDSSHWRPIPLFRLLHLEIYDAGTLALLSAIFKTALLMVTIGLLTRTSATLAFFLSLYVYGLPQNFYKISHSTVFVPFLILIFAVARSGDACSIDAWLRKLRHKSASINPNGAYRWPIRAGWVLMALAFFGSGKAKLTASGLHWIFSDSLSTMILAAQYKPLEERSAIALYVSQTPWLCMTMAGMAVLFEIAAPLVLFSRVARFIILTGLIGMMCGIRICLGFWLYPWFVLFLLFIPWEHLANLWSQWKQTSAPASAQTGTAPAAP